MLHGSPRTRLREPRIGLLGGTFDPPHIAHLFVAQEALTQLGLERVYFVPSRQPPHKRGQQISEAAHRLAMLERAIASNPSFAVSTIELERAGPSFTVDTLTHLRAQWGSQPRIALIVGWDMLLDLPRWRQPGDIVDAVDWIVAAHRPGYDAERAADDALTTALPNLPAKLIKLPVPQLGISATDLRWRVASSLPIRYLVPDAVAAYIAEHGLYHDASSSAPGSGSAYEVRRDGAASPPEARLDYDAHALDQEARP